MELDQSPIGWYEPTRAVVEAAKMIFEVDVEPFTAGLPRSVSCNRDEASADALSSSVGCNHDVLDPRVDEAVPEHVDEAHEGVAVAGDHPSQALALCESSPVPLGLVEDASLEGFRVERVHLCVGEGTTPLVRDWLGHDIPHARWHPGKGFATQLDRR